MKSPPASFVCLQATAQNVGIGTETPIKSYWEIGCSCPVNTRVIGGGGHRDNNGAQTDIHVNFSGPETDGLGWRVLLSNSGTTSRMVQVWAICAKIF